MSKFGSLFGSVEQIEAMIQKKFSSKCDPGSLVNAISREVSKRKTKNKSIGKTIFLVPNDFTLTLGEVDFQRLSSARIMKSLYEAVERQVIRENAFMNGNLMIRFEKSTEGSGLIKISSKNTSGDTGKFTRILDDKTDDDDDQNTIVIEKKTLEMLRNVPTNLASPMEHEIAIIKVTSQNLEDDLDSNSQDVGTELILSGRAVSIGRKEICDLTLQDVSVSRIHASLTYERHRHIIRDENSHNGIFVNSEKVDKDGIFLNDGDIIQLGNSILKYEVL